MLFTFIAFRGGSRLGMFVHSTTGIGSFKNTGAEFCVNTDMRELGYGGGELRQVAFWDKWSRLLLACA